MSWSTERALSAAGCLTALIAWGCAGTALPEWSRRSEAGSAERDGAAETSGTVELDPVEGVPLEEEAIGLPATRLLAVGLESRAGGQLVHLRGDGRFRYSTFRLEEPDRFVVDLAGVLVDAGARAEVPGEGLVLAVRTGQYQRAPDPVARVVVDLAEPVEPEVEERTAGLVIRLGGEPDSPGAEGAESAASSTERGGERQEIAASTADDLRPPSEVGTADGDWRELPLYGADVRAFAVDPADPDRVYLGTSGGQLYRSDDGGLTWQDAAANLPFPGWVISALRFDPNRPERLWMTGWGVFGGGIVAWTEDGGEVWKVRRDGLEMQQVYSLALVRGDEGRLYIGTRDGVYGTEDDGESWRKLTHSQPQLQKVTSLAIDPLNRQRVLAGTWEQAYRSDDAGATWHRVPEGMILDSEVFTLVPVPGRAGELWASTCGWVYHGIGFGEKWTRHKAWGPERRRTPAFEVISADHLLAGTIHGLEVSTDGGATWRQQGPQGMAILNIAYDSRRPDRILVGTEGDGVWRSLDRGEHFTPAAEGLTNLRVRDIVRAGGDLLFSVSGAGPRSGIYRSRDGGSTFSREGGDLPPVLDLTVAGARVYAATERGLYELAGADWRGIAELGDRRVERVEAGPGGVVAVTRSGLFVSRGGLFTALEYEHGVPLSVAVTSEAVWIADSAGLYQLTPSANHTVATPFLPGRLQALGSDVLWSGEEGSYLRSTSGWRKLGEDRAMSLVTGDGERPVLLLEKGGRAALLDTTGGTVAELELPVPAWQASAVLLDGDTIYLGTNGQGLWKGRL